MGYYGLPACTEGTYAVMRKALTGEEIAQGRLALPEYQQTPPKVLLLIRGAPTQQYGADYQVTGNELVWSGLGLDGELEPGDEVTVVYQ